MGKMYRVVSRRQLPLISHADFSAPQDEFLLIHIGSGKTLRVTLPRSTRWEVGETVQIDDAVISATLIEWVICPAASPQGPSPGA